MPKHHNPMSLYFRSLDGLIEEHLMNVYLGLRNIYPQLIKIIANCEDMMKGDGGGWNGLIEKNIAKGTTDPGVDCFDQ